MISSTIIPSGNQKRFSLSWHYFLLRLSDLDRSS
jgi:hypothetical protein